MKNQTYHPDQLRLFFDLPLLEEPNPTFVFPKMNLINEVYMGYRRRSAPVKTLTSSQDAADTLRSIIPVDKLNHHEMFYCLLLNQANQVMNVYKVSEGGVAATSVDVKLILQAAILSNSPAIILAHNHPSGNIQPSTADINLTQKIKQATTHMDIRVLDHVIISEERYYSFADEGQI